MARYDPAAFGSGKAALIRIVSIYLASAVHTSSCLSDTVTSRTMLKAPTPVAPIDTIASSLVPKPLTRAPVASAAAKRPSPSRKNAAAGMAPKVSRLRK